ncbi:MAG: NAD-dependent epimerase/dehydratase family protein [SAR202 cluster bacterium]|nr:NAD-dependent epimerase/dehydratase family protein [SAR202 cluster bacterium]
MCKTLLSKGSHVVALIQDNDPQSQLYRSGIIKQLTIVNGNLEDYWTLERAINQNAVETVIHLGAQAVVGAAFRSPLGTFESNIRGTYNLLEACRNHSSLIDNIVVASSDKAYGEHQTLPYCEDAPLVGRNPYDVSKSCADLIAQSYHHTYGTPVGIARCGNIYGGGDLNWSRIVPTTIRAFHDNQSPLIRSDGTFVRDYLYVKDAVNGYLTLAEELYRPEVAGQAFNFGNEAPTTVLELVAEIQKLMNAEHLDPKVLNTAKAEIHKQYLSTAKSREILNWKPKNDLRSGLIETINWYREFLEGK